MTSPTIEDQAETSNVLRMRGVSKTFGAVAALKNVDLDVNRGEVLALVGDNGAGKSTLIKILSGVFPSDSGTIYIDGKERAITSPADARSAGIATVYQDLALCDNLTVAFSGNRNRVPRLSAL